MGGNALKNVKIIRFNKSEYNRVILEIKEKLKEYKTDIPYHLESKTSFGDLDILIESSDTNNIYDEIIRLFNPVEILDNYVISFSYPSNEHNTYYQIDIIPVESIGSAMLYYSYSDFGNIIGKCVSYHGFTFGSDGFSIKIKNRLIGIENDNPYYTLGKIKLTNNIEEICLLLGILYSQWLNIKTEEDIYKIIVSSKFYNKEAFEFIPYKYSKNIYKRELYKGFLNYIGIENYSNIDNKKQYNINWNLQKVLITLYNKDNEFDKIKEEIIKINERKNKFSSSFFMKYGITGISLGKKINDFKTSLNINDNNKWNIFLDTHTKDEIEILVDFYINSDI
jgi:hypothetical protein